MNDIHFTDSTWKAIAQTVEGKLASERARLEDVKLDAAQTGFCRGRISAFKELLALPVRKVARVGMDEPQ